MDDQDQINWQLSGMVTEDKYLSDLRMRSTLVSFASNERLSSDRRLLKWDLEKHDSLEDFANFSRSPSGALDQFVRITKPEDALVFIKKYGPAGLCHHGLPTAHNEGTAIDEVDRWAKVRHESRCTLMADAYGSYTEDAGWYIDVAKAFKRVLTAESKIRAWEQSGYALPEWRLARASIEGVIDDDLLPKPTWELSEVKHNPLMATILRHPLVTAVNTWFVGAGIHPRIEMQMRQKNLDRQLQMDTSGFPSNAFSAVVIQLGHVVSGDAHLATCSNCGNQYAPRRTPKRTQRNWCGSRECIKEKNRINQQTARRKAQKS